MLVGNFPWGALGLCSLAVCVSGFHIPDVSLDTQVDASSTSTNSGLINSTLMNNWKQSLNVGSVSISATLVILFVVLCMYIRLQNHLNTLQRCIILLRDDLTTLTRSANPKKRTLSSVY